MISLTVAFCVLFNEFESNFTGLKSMSSPASAPPGAHIFGPSRKFVSSRADFPPTISSLLDHFAKIKT